MGRTMKISKDELRDMAIKSMRRAKRGCIVVYDKAHVAKKGKRKGTRKQDRNKAIKDYD